MDGKGEDQFRYIGQVWRALEKYKRFIQERETLLVGDFNSNKIFDRPHKDISHSRVVEILEQEGIVSVYHHFFHEQQGSESRPTFYLYKNRTRPFHLDYCFAPRDWCERVRHVRIGGFRPWSQWSDHCPLMVEFQDK
jgi:endonuclease/exonuclease/phosphatase family metal-dependent hydrolase